MYATDLDTDVQCKSQVQCNTSAQGMCSREFSLIYNISSKNLAPLIIQHLLPKLWKMVSNFWQRLSHVYAIYGNWKHAQLEY